MRALLLSVVGLLSFGLQGCALLGDPLEQAAKGGGRLVKYYCENVTIPEVRAKIRERVNYHASPASIEVKCPDGSPALKTGPATDPPP